MKTTKPIASNILLHLQGGLSNQYFPLITFLMVSMLNAKLTPFFTRERAEEEGTLGGRLGSFIVMQKNATIKNIILGDVSSLITHRASSKLSSRWISSFNEILRVWSQGAFTLHLRNTFSNCMLIIWAPQHAMSSTGSVKSMKVHCLKGSVSQFNCISLLYLLSPPPFLFFPNATV